MHIYIYIYIRQCVSYTKEQPILHEQLGSPSILVGFVGFILFCFLSCVVFYCFVCLHPVSCFPNVVSSVFGLSLSVFILCLVFPMLPVVSPDCPIVIVPSVFFIVYLNTEICFDSKFRSKTYNKTKQ